VTAKNESGGPAGPDTRDREETAEFYDRKGRQMLFLLFGF
jgi:hypothetical protein